MNIVIYKINMKMCERGPKIQAKLDWAYAYI